MERTMNLQQNFRQINIKGSDYHFKLLDGRTGFRVGLALNKIILPLIGESVDAGRHDDVFHGAPRTFKSMAETLITQLDNIEAEKIIFDDLFGYLVVDGQQVKLENVIIGKYDVLIELVTFALKENFGELFAGKLSHFNFLAPLINQDSQTSTE